MKIEAKAEKMPRATASQCQVEAEIIGAVETTVNRGHRKSRTKVKQTIEIFI